MKFSTKGGVLEKLKKVVTQASVLDCFIFRHHDFLENPEKIITSIRSFFKEDILIVRSSAKNEDCESFSNAGHFQSHGNIDKNGVGELEVAIRRVLDSYDSIDSDNEVLVQPMLTDIKMAGVLFTCDIDTLAPYYVIDYTLGNDNDSVTSGSTCSSSTFISFKYSDARIENRYLKAVINLAKELEKIFDNPFLDIEFAFNEKDELFLLQVRPIIVNEKKDNLSKIDLKNSIRKIRKKIVKLSKPHPDLLGKKTLFGVMPDWNPAEIIGVKPRSLALSLYRELVTDTVWALQRNDYGYRNLTSHPLMVSFLGVPFIDVRVDFNSFIPKNLDEKIAEKLVDHYLERLEETPSLHDKIEFEIVHSCYYLNLPEKLRNLSSYEFAECEMEHIKISLLELTNNVIDPEKGLYKEDIKKVEMLEEKYQSVLNSHLSTIDKIFWLMEYCKTYGTLPFAGVARAAFIAVQFLKSFKDCGIVTTEEYERILNSLNTVSKQMQKDFSKLDKDEFLKKYGHLRPGTYDILSYRYDEKYDFYFGEKVSSEKDCEDISFRFTDKMIDEIDSLLVKNGVKVTGLQLIQFIRESIEGREYAKFVFTKVLSHLLVIIEDFGKRFGFSRDEISFLDVDILKNMYATLDHRDVEDILRSDIEKNMDFYRFTKAVKFPSLIMNPEDIDSFHLSREEPNFVTLKRVSDEIVLEHQIEEIDISGKIVFIKSADPGYDFLFSRKISGLVTLFGGANSHMTIRCAELGIPAVIGAGEKNFEEWSRASRIEIDSANKRVRILV